MRPLDNSEVVRGQFAGYRKEEGVSPESDVETLAPVRLHVDSWRWRGVPFYIRAGKSMAVTATEVFVKLRQPPAIFADDAPDHNYFRFRVTPNLEIAVSALVKAPGDEIHGKMRS